jgi:plasmid maintenance system antidote protein VapI
MALRIGRSRLPELLKKNDLSQTEFAEILDVTDGFISMVINNKRHFSYPIAAQAAYILKCSMEDLHERFEE